MLGSPPGKVQAERLPKLGTLCRLLPGRTLEILPEPKSGGLPFQPATSLVDGSARPDPSWCSACEARACPAWADSLGRTGQKGTAGGPGASSTTGNPGCRVRPKAGSRWGAKGQKRERNPFSFRLPLSSG